MCKSNEQSIAQNIDREHIKLKPTWDLEVYEKPNRLNQSSGAEREIAFDRQRLRVSVSRDVFEIGVNKVRDLLKSVWTEIVVICLTFNEDTKCRSYETNADVVEKKNIQRKEEMATNVNIVVNE